MLGIFSRHKGTPPHVRSLNDPEFLSDFGPKCTTTEHLSVPELARHLMDELPRQFGGLLFSATVYRYEIAAPWIIDVNVHGLPAYPWDDTEQTDEMAGRVKRWIDQYNHRRDDTTRFMGPNVIVLREYERHSHSPGRVSVRRYHLRHPITRRLAMLRETVNGLLTRWVI